MKRFLCLIALAGVVLGTVCYAVKAQEKADKEQSAQDRAELTLQQERVKLRYKQFQDKLLKLADLTEATDPARAALLRRAFTEGKEKEIHDRLDKLVQMIRQDRLGTAVTEQGKLRDDLYKILVMLMAENSPERNADAMKRLKEYLDQVKKLIKEEEEIVEQIGRNGNAGQIANKQGKTADRTGDLAKKIADNEGLGNGEGKGKGKGEGEGKGKGKGEGEGEGKGKGKGEGEGKGKGKGEGEGKGKGKGKGEGGGKGEGKGKGEGEGKGKGEGKGEGKGKGKGEGEGEGKGKGKGKGEGKGKGGEGGGEEGEDPPPGADQPQDKIESARKRIREAEKRMREAKQKLEKAQREGAEKAAKEALEELKKIEKELEELLRQLREEELERLLAYLEARFKKMLEMQVAVYEGTLRLDRTPKDQRDNQFTIQSGRLSRDERLIEVEGQKALRLLREDGTSVAMTEAVVEMMEDIRDVQINLSRGDTGTITQGIEEDIIQALEEMIEALKKRQQDLNQPPPPPGDPPPAGEPPDPALIELLAEIKMLKSLQLRINRRTERTRRALKDPDDEIGRAEEESLRKQLSQLADRQKRLQRAAHDLAKGRNQ